MLIKGLTAAVIWLLPLASAEFTSQATNRRSAVSPVQWCVDNLWLFAPQRGAGPSLPCQGWNRQQQLCYYVCKSSAAVFVGTEGVPQSVYSQLTRWELSATCLLYGDVQQFVLCTLHEAETRLANASHMQLVNLWIRCYAAISAWCSRYEQSV